MTKISPGFKSWFFTQSRVTLLSLSLLICKMRILALMIVVLVNHINRSFMLLLHEQLMFIVTKGFGSRFPVLPKYPASQFVGPQIPQVIEHPFLQPAGGCSWLWLLAMAAVPSLPESLSCFPFLPLLLGPEGSTPWKCSQSQPHRPAPALSLCGEGPSPSHSTRALRDRTREPRNSFLLWWRED